MDVAILYRKLEKTKIAVVITIANIISKNLLNTASRNRVAWIIRTTSKHNFLKKIHKIPKNVFIHLRYNYKNWFFSIHFPDATPVDLEYQHFLHCTFMCWIFGLLSTIYMSIYVKDCVNWRTQDQHDPINVVPLWKWWQSLPFMGRRTFICIVSTCNVQDWDNTCLG